MADVLAAPRRALPVRIRLCPAGVQAPYVGRLVVRKPFELEDLRSAIAKVA